MMEIKSRWAGILVVVAQPAEEDILGAEAMVNDGLYTRLVYLNSTTILHAYRTCTPRNTGDSKRGCTWQEPTK